MFNNIRRQAEKQAKKLGLVGTAAVAVVNEAMAALPAGVTTATADMQADAVTLATIFLVAGIAVTAFMFLRRGAKG